MVVGKRNSPRAPTVAQFPRLHPHGAATAALGCSIAIGHEVQTSALHRRAVQTVAAALPTDTVQFLFPPPGSDGLEEFQDRLVEGVYVFGFLRNERVQQ